MISVRILVLLSIICFYQGVYAFDFDIGGGYSNLSIGPKNQEYTTSGGSTEFSPDFKSIKQGSRYHIELIFDYIGLEYGAIKNEFEAYIPNDVFSEKPSEAILGKGEFTATNQGINLHLRQKIGGIFFGLGTFNSKEKITTADASVQKRTFSNEASFMYRKFGAELLFGSIILQANYFVGKFGEHNIQLNSVELCFSF